MAFSVYTDEINLDTEYVTTSEGELSLWEVKVKVLEIYSSSVPSALNIVSSPERLEKAVHSEFYRKVNKISVVQQYIINLINGKPYTVV